MRDTSRRRLQVDFPRSEVSAWFLRVFLQPITVLMQPWRAHQRLKLVTLYRMAADQVKGKSGAIPQLLEAHYRRFSSWPAREKHKRGSFSDFIAYINTSLAKHEHCEKLVALAKEWRSKYIRRQIFVTFLSLSAVIVLGELFLLVYVLAIRSIMFLPDIKQTFLSDYALHFITVPSVFSLSVVVIMLGLVYYMSLHTRFFLLTQRSGLRAMRKISVSRREKRSSAQLK